MESRTPGKRIRDSGTDKKLTIVQFIETYNDSIQSKKADTPLNMEDLDSLFHRVGATMKSQCGLRKTPDFEINVFGKITKLYDATIV